MTQTKEKTKFTPGPWHAINYGGYWQFRTEPFYDIGFDLTDEEESGQAEANAKLIAAAPDMYEALKFVLDRLDISGNMSHAAKEYYQEAVNKIEAAIKKATE